MSEPVRISERDLRSLADIVTADREEAPADGLPPSLLTDLSEQIASDVMSFQGLDSRQQTVWFAQGLPAEDDDDDGNAEAFWAHYWDSSCSYPETDASALRSVTLLSDFHTAQEWHSTGMYSDYLAAYGVEHELMMCLPAGPGRTIRLLFFRCRGSDFSERDLALLTLLRPHLRDAYLAAQRRRQIPELTARHWELLRLVAAGATNRQIASRLRISEGTVRTHMESIFERLQVTSRAAAVARAFPGMTTDLPVHAGDLPVRRIPGPGDLAARSRLTPPAGAARAYS